jgi:hypothetical protein
VPIADADVDGAVRDAPCLTVPDSYRRRSADLDFRSVLLCLHPAAECAVSG